MRQRREKRKNRRKSKTQTAKLTNKQINGKHVIKGLHTQCPLGGEGATTTHRGWSCGSKMVYGPFGGRRMEGSG